MKPKYEEVQKRLRENKTGALEKRRMTNWSDFCELQWDILFLHIIVTSQNCHFASKALKTEGSNPSTFGYLRNFKAPLTATNQNWAALTCGWECGTVRGVLDG
ncbi:hypothetical protein P5673_028190 [Acropora cervicornis]|uniref:Uncharacterized protein n=1 Tax=Acropora cervicornis TaxID=6130 RepID=A0AAD9PXQ8_ACRCE|nr:hypothetical protein P5673_028190 [Acropora cervicornis]